MSIHLPSFLPWKKKKSILVGQRANFVKCSTHRNALGFCASFWWSRSRLVVRCNILGWKNLRVNKMSLNYLNICSIKSVKHKVVNSKKQNKKKNVIQQLFRLAVAKQTASHFQLSFSCFFIQRTVTWIYQKTIVVPIYIGYCTLDAPWIFLSEPLWAARWVVFYLNVSGQIGQPYNTPRAFD
jgi:hypothetical protein